MNDGSFTSFFDQLDKDILTASENILEVWHEMVADRLQRDVYDKTPSEYERTYQLKNSLKHRIRKISNTEWRLEVYHDTDMIHPNPDKYQHWSPTDGDSSDYLPQIIEAGGGMLFGKGYWTRSRKYMSTINKQLIAGNARKDFKLAMRMLGYTFSTR